MKNPGIYILTSPSGKQYVGRDVNLPRRANKHLSGNSPECPGIHKAIQKYGRDAFSAEIIRYPGISHEALNAVERWWIRRLQTLAPKGYNLNEGGDGLIPSEETRQKLSESNSKRVADGTHHLLSGEIQRALHKSELKKAHTTSWVIRTQSTNKLRMAHTPFLAVRCNANALRMAHIIFLVVKFRGVSRKNDLRMARITSSARTIPQNNVPANGKKPNGAISLRCLGFGMKFTIIPSSVVLNSCLKIFPICLILNRHTFFRGQYPCAEHPFLQKL